MTLAGIWRAPRSSTHQFLLQRLGLGFGVALAYKVRPWLGCWHVVHLDSRTIYTRNARSYGHDEGEVF